MSERARDKGNDLSSAQGQGDLSDLRASKDLHKTNDPRPVNEADLSSASISATNILRAAPRHDPRSYSLRSTVLTSPSHGAEKRASSPSAQPAGPNGILKNPTYQYTGGFLSKIITFIANVLKFVERLFLRLLGARDLVAPQHSPQSRPINQAQSTHEVKKTGAKDGRQGANRIIRS